MELWSMIGATGHLDYAQHKHFALEIGVEAVSTLLLPLLHQVAFPTENSICSGIARWKGLLGYNVVITLHNILVTIQKWKQPFSLKEVIFSIILCSFLYDNKQQRLVWARLVAVVPIKTIHSCTIDSEEAYQNNTSTVQHAFLDSQVVAIFYHFNSLHCVFYFLLLFDHPDEPPPLYLISLFSSALILFFFLFLLVLLFTILILAKYRTIVQIMVIWGVKII